MATSKKAPSAAESAGVSCDTARKHLPVVDDSGQPGPQGLSLRDLLRTAQSKKKTLFKALVASLAVGAGSPSPSPLAAPRPLQPPAAPPGPDNFTPNGPPTATPSYAAADVAIRSIDATAPNAPGAAESPSEHGAQSSGGKPKGQSSQPPPRSPHMPSNAAASGAADPLAQAVPSTVPGAGQVGTLGLPGSDGGPLAGPAGLNSGDGDRGEGGGGGGGEGPGSGDGDGDGSVGARVPATTAPGPGWAIGALTVMGTAFGTGDGWPGGRRGCQESAPGSSGASPISPATLCPLAAGLVPGVGQEPAGAGSEAPQAAAGANVKSRAQVPAGDDAELGPLGIATAAVVALTAAVSTDVGSQPHLPPAAVPAVPATSAAAAAAAVAAIVTPAAGMLGSAVPCSPARVGGPRSQPGHGSANGQEERGDAASSAVRPAPQPQGDERGSGNGSGGISAVRAYVLRFKATEAVLKTDKLMLSRRNLQRAGLQGADEVGRLSQRVLIPHILTLRLCGEPVEFIITKKLAKHQSQQQQGPQPKGESGSNEGAGRASKAAIAAAAPVAEAAAATMTGEEDYLVSIKLKQSSLTSAGVQLNDELRFERLADGSYNLTVFAPSGEPRPVKAVVTGSVAASAGAAADTAAPPVAAAPPKPSRGSYCGTLNAFMSRDLRAASTIVGGSAGDGAAGAVQSERKMGETGGKASAANSSGAGSERWRPGAGARSGSGAVLGEVEFCPSTTGAEASCVEGEEGSISPEGLRGRGRTVAGEVHGRGAAVTASDGDGGDVRLDSYGSLPVVAGPSEAATAAATAGAAGAASGRGTTAAAATAAGQMGSGSGPAASNPRKRKSGSGSGQPSVKRVPAVPAAAATPPLPPPQDNGAAARSEQGHKSKAAHGPYVRCSNRVSDPSCCKRLMRYMWKHKRIYLNKELIEEGGVFHGLGTGTLHLVAEGGSGRWQVTCRPRQDGEKNSPYLQPVGKMLKGLGVAKADCENSSAELHFERVSAVEAAGSPSGGAIADDTGAVAPALTFRVSIRWGPPRAVSAADAACEHTAAGLAGHNRPGTLAAPQPYWPPLPTTKPWQRRAKKTTLTAAAGPKEPVTAATVQAAAVVATAAVVVMGAPAAPATARPPPPLPVALPPPPAPPALVDPARAAAESLTLARLRNQSAPLPALLEPGSWIPVVKLEPSGSGDGIGIKPAAATESAAELTVCGVVFTAGPAAAQARAAAAGWLTDRHRLGHVHVPMVLEGEWGVPGLDAAGGALPGWPRKPWHALYTPVKADPGLDLGHSGAAAPAAAAVAPPLLQMDVLISGLQELAAAARQRRGSTRGSCGNAVDPDQGQGRGWMKEEVCRGAGLVGDGTGSTALLSVTGPIQLDCLRPCRDLARGGLGVCTEVAIAAGAPVGVLPGHVLEGRRGSRWDENGSDGGSGDDASDAAVYGRQGYQWLVDEQLREELRRRGGGDIACAWQFLALSYQFPFPDELSEVAARWRHGGSAAGDAAAGEYGASSVLGSGAVPRQQEPRPPPLAPQSYVLCMLGHGSVLTLLNDARPISLDTFNAQEQQQQRQWPEQPNCVVIPATFRGVVVPVVVALRPLSPGDQLLLEYGTSWWREIFAAWEMAVEFGLNPVGLLHEQQALDAAAPAAAPPVPPQPTAADSVADAALPPPPSSPLPPQQRQQRQPWVDLETAMTTVLEQTRSGRGNANAAAEGRQASVTTEGPLLPRPLPSASQPSQAPPPPPEGDEAQDGMDRKRRRSRSWSKQRPESRNRDRDRDRDRDRGRNRDRGQSRGDHVLGEIEREGFRHRREGESRRDRPRSPDCDRHRHRIWAPDREPERERERDNPKRRRMRSLSRGCDYGVLAAVRMESREEQHLPKGHQDRQDRHERDHQDRQDRRREQRGQKAPSPDQQRPVTKLEELSPLEQACGQLHDGGGGGVGGLERGEARRVRDLDRGLGRAGAAAAAAEPLRTASSGRRELSRDAVSCPAIDGGGGGAEVGSAAAAGQLGSAVAAAVDVGCSAPQAKRVRTGECERTSAAMVAAAAAAGVSLVDAVGPKLAPLARQRAVAAAQRHHRPQEPPPPQPPQPSQPYLPLPPSPPPSPPPPPLHPYPPLPPSPPPLQEPRVLLEPAGGPSNPWVSPFTVGGAAMLNSAAHPPPASAHRLQGGSAAGLGDDAGLDAGGQPPAVEVGGAVGPAQAPSGFTRAVQIPRSASATTDITGAAEGAAAAAAGPPERRLEGGRPPAGVTAPTTATRIRSTALPPSQPPLMSGRTIGGARCKEHQAAATSAMVTTSATTSAAAAAAARGEAAPAGQEQQPRLVTRLSQLQPQQQRLQGGPSSRGADEGEDYRKRYRPRAEQMQQRQQQKQQRQERRGSLMQVHGGGGVQVEREASSTVSLAMLGEPASSSRGNGGGGGVGARKAAVKKSRLGITVDCKPAYEPFGDAYRNRRPEGEAAPGKELPDLGCEELVLLMMNKVARRDEHPLLAAAAAARGSATTTAAATGQTDALRGALGKGGSLGGCASGGSKPHCRLGQGDATMTTTTAAAAADPEAHVPRFDEWLRGLRLQRLQEELAARPGGWINPWVIHRDGAGQVHRAIIS